MKWRIRVFTFISVLLPQISSVSLAWRSAVTSSPVISPVSSPQPPPTIATAPGGPIADSSSPPSASSAQAQTSLSPVSPTQSTPVVITPGPVLPIEIQGNLSVKDRDGNEINAGDVARLFCLHSRNGFGTLEAIPTANFAGTAAFVCPLPLMHLNEDGKTCGFTEPARVSCKGSGMDMPDHLKHINLKVFQQTTFTLIPSRTKAAPIIVHKINIEMDNFDISKIALADAPGAPADENTWTGSGRPVAFTTPEAWKRERLHKSPRWQVAVASMIMLILSGAFMFVYRM